MKILITDKIDEDGIALLRENFEVELKEGMTEEEIANKIKDYDAMIVRSATSVTERIIAAGSRLRAIGRAGTGVDNIDIETANKLGIPVINAPLGNVNAVSELVISMMIVLARDMHNADRCMKDGVWDKRKGTELSGKKLGIIGLGRIGFDVAAKARAMGMSLLVHDPYAKRELIEKLGAELSSLDALLRRSDYITVHVPLLPQTENMIGREQFKIMKDGVIIINCARGKIIDENALYDAIKSGKVAGAGLDVYSSEPEKPFEKEPSSKLLKLSNIIATPHIGASTQEAQKRVGIEIARNITDFLKEGKSDFIVNRKKLKPAVVLKHLKE